MNHKVIILIACLFTISIHTMAQQWQNYYQMLTDVEDTENDNSQEIYQLLCELEQNPINLNRATREQLQQFPFLTEQDIDGILEYLDRYRPIRSLGELAMVENLDYLKRQLLNCFVYPGEAESKPSFPSIKTILKGGHADILLTGSIPFYERKGDKKGYLGYPYQHNVRLNYTYGQQLRLGIVGAQDAGEPFFANRNHAGYDFYSYYLQLKQAGRLKNLVIGRYRTSFALGLVMNTNFTMGKQGMLSSFNASRIGLRPHSSTSPYNYLQGAAATVEITKDLDITAFCSYRKLDATLTSDSLGIRTIVKTGYHRTESEMLKKGNASESVAGGHIGFHKRGFQMGATLTYSSLDKPLAPDTSVVYRRYQAAGRNIWNASIDYGYTCGQFSFRGETATGSCNSWASLHLLSWRLSSTLDLLGLYRFYSKSYYSLFSNSYSDGGTVQNESGAYAGLSWHPNRKVSVQAYADVAYSPWPRYRVSQASHSNDFLLSASYTRDTWSIGSRYRLRLRQRNDTTGVALAWRTEHRGRLWMGYERSIWSLKAQVDITHYHQENTNSTGWIASGRIGLKGKSWRLNALIGYFNTDDYNSRQYLYEGGMLYQFSFPVFYGRGLRCALQGRYDSGHRWFISARCSTTRYFDRDYIGSSYQQVDGSSITDLDLQLHIRL